MPRLKVQSTTMAKADYYEMLGVARDADEATLKKAFRKLAMQYHPDRNPGDAEAEQRFKEINEAYEVLKDPKKRQAYDQFGHAAFEAGMGGGRGGPRGFDFGSSFADVFEDIFGEFMGGGRGGGRGGGSRGADMRFDLEITLEDAFNGKQTEITVPASATCEVCDGSGAAEGTQPVTCPTCNGHGKVRATQGFFTIERTCPACHGVGRVIKDPCKNCGGAGRVRRDKTLAVNIPAGIEDGMRIRLSGEGEAGVRGGPPGDLYIFLAVAPHPVFQRDGVDVSCRVPIPMTRAALGGTVEVPTLEGARVRLNIPAGTQSGHQFRLRSKGMPSVQGRGGRGDMYVIINVETPVNLSARQRELLEEFEREGSEGGTSSSPQSEGFFAKVKELWSDLTD